MLWLDAFFSVLHFHRVLFVHVCITSNGYSIRLDTVVET